ncbi:MAG TPA: hypothetical protein DF383_10005 [Deltaproteobacteria bacterium]|nr:hypothetical protein [Deltaproteobacteria bacterium]
MKHRFLFILFLTLIACGRKSSLSQAKTEPLDLPHPVYFTIPQRSTSALPGSDGRIMLSLGDITMGQVTTTLAWKDGRELAPSRSLQENDIIAFSLGGRDYTLKLQRLENHLIGMDYAHFELRETSSSRLWTYSLPHPFFHPLLHILPAEISS